MAGMASSKFPATAIATEQLRQLVAELGEDADPLVRLQLASVAAQVGIALQLGAIHDELVSINSRMPE
jgi:hypothetical protein